MPALAISVIAGSANAQDSSGFGLLAALKSQSQAGNTQADEIDNEFADDQFDADLYDEDFNSESNEQDSPNTEADLADFAGAVDVSDYDLVDLHVNNEDLGNILQLLSIQSQRNIISSKSVQASVTADLYGVTFYEALDSILHVNGYGYIEKGNFIYVYTSEELVEFEALSRSMVTKVITLDYLNATDAAEFSKMLLSENGSITANAETESFTITDGVPTGADGYANHAIVVIHDYEEQVEEITSLIQELDVKPVQILVEATILQTSLNEANAFGMDFALIQNLDFTDFVGTGGPLSVVDSLISGSGETVDGTRVNAAGGGHGTGVSSTAGNTAGAATLKAGFVNGDVGVFLRVLDEITDVTVVSNPKLLTLNRQPARVLVGTRVGYLNTTTTDTSTTQSVEFLDVGTQLSVRPFVSQNNKIRLELRPQVSSVKFRNISDNSGSIVTIPDEDTTEMNTNIMANDGQTVVLGGLFTETTSTTRRQVPVLGDIPLIGNAFKGYDDSVSRSEIIFLITPSIVNDTVLAEAGDMGNQYAEHARYGARKGLLPWSRERRVGQLLIDARNLADTGDIEKALSKVDRALRLMPMSPDARSLRTELTGELRSMPSRSLTNGSYHNELHFGGTTSEVSSPNTVNPFFNATPESSEFAEVIESDTPVFDPSSDEDFTPESTFEEESFAEVPVDTVSDASSSNDFSTVDPFTTQSSESFDSFESFDSPIASSSDEFVSGEGYTQIAVDDATDWSMQSQSDAEFEQMKSVVTGEDTSVAFSSPEGSFEDFESSTESDSWGEDEQSFSTVADGFTGQLIIPLPSGGVLRLDWPLGFDYVASGDSSTAVESQATFTQVPTEDE